VKQIQFQRLTEGAILSFRIIGIVTSPDGKTFFKLNDPNGVKHLLARDFYEKYNFDIDRDIQCRIDRISCSGKIYIEPLHPVYELNKTYLFPVIRFEQGNNATDTTETHAVLLDQLGYEITITADDLPPGIKQGDLVKASVVRIKKGRVYVSTDDQSDLFPEIKHGDRHFFRIIGLKSYGEGYDFFILEDDRNRRIKLREKYYFKYGLEVGKSLYCRMIRETDDFYFEPVHPVFEPGMNYRFEIIGQKLVDNYPQGESEVVILKNPYGKEILLRKSDIPISKVVGDHITCRVTDIQKGEPLLDPPL
jgi:hypothetical protein